MPDPPKDWKSLRVLTANVGNVSLKCSGAYNSKLCERSVEESIAERIKELSPQVVFLQEVLHPSQCSGWIESDRSKVCHIEVTSVEPLQPRRLLGDQYTIACYERKREAADHPRGLECIALSVDVGTIKDCPSGEICFNIGRADQISGECNPEFVVHSVDASLYNTIPITLVNVHPNSRNIDCRSQQLQQIFEGGGNSGLTNGKYTIIAGDFNTDPYRGDSPSIAYWDRFVGLYGSNKPFYYHSGIAEKDPPFFTVFNYFGKRTVDHILSNFALGEGSTLGESPNTSRLDKGRGMDHRAILADLWIPPK